MTRRGEQMTNPASPRWWTGAARLATQALWFIHRFIYFSALLYSLLKVSRPELQSVDKKQWINKWHTSCQDVDTAYFGVAKQIITCFWICCWYCMCIHLLDIQNCARTEHLVSFLSWVLLYYRIKPGLIEGCWCGTVSPVLFTGVPSQKKLTIPNSSILEKQYKICPCSTLTILEKSYIFLKQ